MTALMQGGGFLIAALAPLATALLHDWSGSFASGWVMHQICIAITFSLYMQLDPTRYADAIDLSEPSQKMPIANDRDDTVLKPAD